MRTARVRSAIGLSLLCGVLFVVFSFQPAAQDRKNQDEFARLAQKALTDGRVGVIVHVAVPWIDQMTTASRRLSGKQANRAAARRQVDADQALSAAIEGGVGRVLADLQGTDVQVKARYSAIPFVALHVSADALARLEQSSNVLGIQEDKRRPLIDPEPDPGEPSSLKTVIAHRDQPELNVSVPLVGAPTVWGWGYTGAGWYVAILDTGIRRTHQFFTGKTIVEACFSQGDCPNGSGTMYGAGSAAPYPNTYSGYDHGTHVAGIATGNYGSLAGVAKDASIVMVQVFSKDVGSLSAWDSDILSGLNYVYSIRGSYNIASVNMSLGGDVYSSPCDGSETATKAAIDNLRAAGIATAIASGNDGSCTGVSTPACISTSVAVGSSDDYDHESSFSNWHATMQKVFAPGSSIYSSTAASDSSYGNKSGTSMAAPHVAGAFALLRQAAPGQTITYLLSALQNTGPGITSRCGSPAIHRIKLDDAISWMVQPHLTIQSAQYGSTDPASGIHGYPLGTQVSITATPDTYAMFINWSGDATGTTSPVTVTVDRDKTVTPYFRYIFAPDASAQKVQNRSFTQVEYINVLTWTPSSANQGLPITKYRIYTMSGSTPTFLADVPADQSRYLHRNAGQNAIQYNIVAVTSSDREGAPAVVSVQ